MHWLEDHVKRLSVLARDVPLGDRPQPFLTAIRELVEAIAQHDEVTACFACHDGLALEASGTTDYDALSAMAQWCIAAAKQTALTLSLGSVQQMVIISGQQKLALFVVGQLAVGILSPATVNLGRALAVPAPQPKETAMKPTLLSQLGGREAIEGVVALFYERVLRDPELAPFFRGASISRLQILQTDFFCSVLGGPPWLGRDLKTVHKGMRVTDQQFDRVAAHLHAALEDAHVPATHITSILELVGSLRSDIVSVAPAQAERRPASSAT